MNNLHAHFSQVTHIIREARFDALKAVNTKLIALYWNIGKYISDRVADNGWGKSVVTQLAAFIQQEDPGTRGFSDKNLWRMKQFYEAYKHDPGNLELVHQLSWTHNLLIFSKTQRSGERAFYLNLAIHERLSKRDLERHIDSGYFERILLASQKLSPPVRVCVRKSHENPSIGVLLCKSRDEEIVEYALSRNVSPTLIADYETKFIAKNILQRKLHEMFGVTDLPG